MMRSRTRCCSIAVALLALTALAGCTKDQPTSATTTSAPAASAAAATPAVPETPIDLAKKLALAKANSPSAVDRQITQFQTSLQANPGKADFWVLLGRAWVRKARESSDPGFYVNANAAADVALDVSPENKLALDLRVLALLNDHKFNEAKELSEKILAKNADEPMAWGSLSDALLELGDFPKAAEAVQKMVDLKPNLPSYSRASYIRWLQGDSKAALEFARLAMDAGRDPSDPEPQAWQVVQAAIIWMHKGDYGGADAGFERALTQVSEYPPALVGRGRVALTKGDFKRAAELFQRAYTQSPLVETAWLMGDAKEAAGDKPGADEAWAHAEKEGRRGDPRTLSLMWSTKNKNVAEALSLAEAERKVRGDLYTDDVLAWALYRNGKFADAKTAIDRACKLGTQDARLLYHQGAITIAAGDAVKGKKLVSAALALSPKFDVTGEAEARKLLDTKLEPKK